MADRKSDNEIQLLEFIKQSVEARLTGQDELEVVDGEPGRRFSVGILNANRPSERAQGTTLRRPESIGFYVRLKKDTSVEFNCRISFSIYYRVRPTFLEQTRHMVGELPENDEIAPVPKYRRIDKVVDGSVIIPRDFEHRTNIDCASINASIESAIHEARDKIAKDAEVWPRPSFKLFGRNLLSPEAYKSAFVGVATDEVPHWRVSFRAEVVDFPSHKRFRILLTNSSDPSEFRVAWHCPEVFNARVFLKGQTSCFSAEPFTAVRNDYRYDTPTWGKGINTVLMVDNETGKAWTEHLPIYNQCRTRSRIGFEDATDTEALAADRDLKLLDRILAWLEEYGSRWDTLVGEQNRPQPVLLTMRKDLESYNSEVERFRRGLQVLKEDETLRKAFHLMNRTFKASGLVNWRLFQICFLVSMVLSLYAREHHEIEWAEEERNSVDVLWFPTGGGKTEAFLAVVVTALFYDRFRGKSLGTTAWLRYPLRMLSVQQLQRLIDIVVQAEQIRCEEQELRSSGDPFSVGYYVGEQNAPNELTFPGRGQDTIDRLYEESTRNQDGLVRYRVLSYCPMCGSDSIRLEVDKEAVRLKHICNSCGFTPYLYISDSEIYRYLPSVLVGTVDRLARAGQTDRFSLIFSGPTAKCPKHGYTSFGECIESKVCQEKLEVVKDVKDPCPALLLQDEIHLLRESLGTYDSHYEGLVDVLSRRFGVGMPPKRMAATATIEGLEQHIFHLYVGEGRCFPVKGMSINDSAYVEVDPQGTLARLYVGILPSGRDADDVSRAVAERLCQLAIQRYTEKADDIYHDFLLIYVNEKNTAGDIRADWRDEYAVQVLTGDKSLDEVRQVIARVESDGAKLHPERLHAVIATSVVSHGVDLERLNQMVIVGMPRSVAEYIQASSRAGRIHAGVIFTVFRWQNRRNVSMYEHFFETHDRLYQLVQPVPVNRVSSPSLERTATGLLASVVYNLFGPKLYESNKRRLNSAQSVIKALANKELIESEIMDVVSEAYFSGFTMMEAYRHQLEDTLEKIIRNQLHLLSTKPDWSFHTRLDPKPVSSLREVGEQVDFGMTPKDMRTARLLQSAWRGG
ncbi:MAG: DEAD/DEAH box helicase [Promethearchaeati archaeon]